MSKPGDFLAELLGARTIGELAAHGREMQHIEKRRRQRLRAREGRTCITEGCSKRLSIYNPAPTCWACDGGIDEAARTRHGRHGL